MPLSTLTVEYCRTRASLWAVISLFLEIVRKRKAAMTAVPSPIRAIRRLVRFLFSLCQRASKEQPIRAAIRRVISL